MQYVRDAPLLGLTEAYKKGKAIAKATGSVDCNAPAAIANKKTEVKTAARAMDQLKEMSEAVKKMQTELDSKKQLIKVVESAVHPIYVVSDKYQI